MPLMLPAQALPEPVDDASGVELPRHFADAMEHLRATSRCDQAAFLRYADCRANDGAALPGSTRFSHPMRLTS